MPVDDGIRGFWRWWEIARERVLRAIEDERGFSDDLVRDISKHVDAIGSLDWELCPGKTSRHGFCLSPAGDPEARLVTEMWRHRGPPPDAIWEYFAARQPGHGSTIDLDGVTFDRHELVVAFKVDDTRERIGASYFHPAFSRNAHDSATALYLLLDGAFGEDGVERWLGDIEPAADRPEHGVSFAAFQLAVADLERKATGERFVVMRRQDESGAPVIALVNQAVKRVDHLLYSIHVAVDLAIEGQNPRGLATEADAAILNELEDELMSSLGSLAVYFGRETRPGHRVIHFYTPEDSAAPSIVDRWTNQHPGRHASIEWIRDPAWDFAKRYM